MTLGVADRQPSLLDEVNRFCGEHLDEDSVFAFLARERDRLFPDELFADLYAEVGRRSVPPSVVATLTVLQRLIGLSDREAVDRFTYDARFRYACGVGDWETGLVTMDHTVLVRFRMRLRDSADPKRIFRVTCEVAGQTGLLGMRRVLDSAPLHDAVATQDTVTLIRAAIRGLLQVADEDLQVELRRQLVRDDDYTTPGKPACDWSDATARTQLIDALARDATALLVVVEGRELDPELAEATELLAAVVGQDLEIDEHGRYGIRRGVAADRIISTVDVEARHGRKSSAGTFDGYKGHIAVDPDSEIVTATAVGPANEPDAAMTEALTDDLTPPGPAPHESRELDDDAPSGDAADKQADPVRPRLYGDAAYGSGDNLADLDDRGIAAMVKVAPATNATGRFTKDRFAIDRGQHTVTCPAGHTVDYTPADDGTATARFGARCGTCPLRADCTAAARGRTITIGPHEAQLTAARARQADTQWQADYTATRPTVERKLAHLLRAGRRVRRRGLAKIDLDWSLRAAGANLARFAKLGLQRLTPGRTGTPAPV